MCKVVFCDKWEWGVTAYHPHPHIPRNTNPEHTTGARMSATNNLNYKNLCTVIYFVRNTTHLRNDDTHVQTVTQSHTKHKQCHLNTVTVKLGYLKERGR